MEMVQLFFFFYIIIRLITEKNSFKDIQEYLWKTPLNNIFTKFFLVLLALALLSPVPVIQVIPVVQTEAGGAKVLKGWTVNDKKTMLNQQTREIAHIPFIIAFPLNLIEKFTYGIPFNFPSSDIIDPYSKSERSDYIANTPGTLTENYQYTLSNCLGTDYNSDYGSFLEVKNIPASCYVQVKDYGIVNFDKSIAGDIFSDYFVSVSKLKKLMNGNLSIMNYAENKSIISEYQTNLNANLIKITKDNTIQKEVDVLKKNLVSVYNSELHNLVNRIGYLAEKVKLINDKYSSGAYIQALNNVFLRKLSLNNKFNYIVSSSEFNVQSTEIKNFQSVRNNIFNKYKDSINNGRKGIYFNQKIDDMDGAITTDKYINNNYPSNIQNINFSFNNGKIVINNDYNLIPNKDGKTVSEFINSDALVKNVKAEFKINFMEKLQSININDSDVKYINILQIKKELGNLIGDKLDGNKLEIFLNQLKDLNKYYIYQYYLDLLNDYVTNMENEYNNYLSTYFKDNVILKGYTIEFKKCSR